MKISIKKRLSSILLCVLFAAMTLNLTGCKDKSDDVATKEEVSFSFTVVDLNNNSNTINVTTKCKTVGEALLEQNLIEGEEGEYGLYVKTVNGITADYDVDGTYWAFYIDGEYAMSGVDTTDIVDGSSYEFRIEK